jgi:hypothetical protein
MHGTVSPSQAAQKGSHMETLGGQYMQKCQYNNKLTQEQNSVEHNALFETVFNWQRQQAGNYITYTPPTRTHPHTDLLPSATQLGSSELTAFDLAKELPAFCGT